MMRLLLAGLGLTLISSVALAHGSQGQFEEANARLTRGEAESALKIFRSIREDGVRDPALEHNLGNAYVRTGALGHAIGAYRRGLRMEPNPSVEEALSRNLEIVRRMLRERHRTGEDGRQFIYADPGGFLYRIVHLVSSGTLNTSALVLWWVLMVLLILRRLEARWSWVGPLAIPVGIVTALTLFMLWGQTHFADRIALGVVVKPEAALLDGPHADARGVALAEGMELRVLESRDGWSQVELPEGRRGWVANETIERL